MPVTVTYANVDLSVADSAVLKSTRSPVTDSSVWVEVTGLTVETFANMVWRDGQWDAGAKVKFNMFDAETSGVITFKVFEDGTTAVEATKFDLDFTASGAPRVSSLFPEFDTVCGGNRLTVTLTDAESFLQSGLKLRFGSDVDFTEFQDVDATSWDSTTQQATFTTPRSLGQTAGVTSVQVRHEQFVSSNLVFEYLTNEPTLFSTSPKITDGTIKLIPSQKTPVTITVDGLGVSSAGDLSITLSGGGTSVSLTASNFKYEAVTGQISFRVTPPSDTTTGLKTLTIASASCSSSKLQISLKMEASSATASPNRHTTTGGTSTLIVSNAPHTNAMPWGTGALTFKCGTNEGQVSYVSKWTATATTVVVLVPAGTVTSGQTETATSCTIYRTADTAKTGPVFDITYYLSYAPYIVNKGNAPPLPCQAPHSYHHTQQL